MIDLLIRFPDRQAAIDFGVAWGATDPATEETTTLIPPGINIHVIGVHNYAESEEEDAPFIEADGWWVMIRADDGIETPAELIPLIVSPEPQNPAIPKRVWA
jgi:hypothetical protein